MSLEGMGPSLAVEGSTNHEVFEIYVERVLAPTLRRAQVVVMDNLSAHKGKRVRELIEQQGCKLLYLASYSADFNPIEEAFSKIKAFILRKAEAGSREALIEAMGAAISAVSRLEMLAVSSSTAGTLHRFNRYEERCKRVSEKGYRMVRCASPTTRLNVRGATSQ
jgi:transposase